MKRWHVRVDRFTILEVMARTGEEPLVRMDLPVAPPPAKPWYLRQDAILTASAVALVGGGALDYALAHDGKDGAVELVPVALYLGGAYLYDVVLPTGRTVQVQRPHGPEAVVYAEGEPVVLSWLQAAPVLLLR